MTSPKTDQSSCNSGRPSACASLRIPVATRCSAEGRCTGAEDDDDDEVVAVVVVVQRRGGAPCPSAAAWARAGEGRRRLCGRKSVESGSDGPRCEEEEGIETLAAGENEAVSRRAGGAALGAVICGPWAPAVGSRAMRIDLFSVVWDDYFNCSIVRGLEGLGRTRSRRPQGVEMVAGGVRDATANCLRVLSSVFVGPLT
jgi:hypothetical protein